jgi:hypothetical protein
MVNEEKDRHVLADAVVGKASIIVTYNLRHFPLVATKPWRVKSLGPSAFFKRLYFADSDLVTKTLRQQAADLHRPFADQLKVLHKAVPAFIDLVSRDNRFPIS